MPERLSLQLSQKLYPGQQVALSLGSYTYPAAGEVINAISLSTNDAGIRVPVLVQSNVAGFEEFEITQPPVTVPWYPFSQAAHDLWAHIPFVSGSYPYPVVVLGPGDKVEVVKFGGCVNVHGGGKTTFRYVDPQDDGNSCRAKQMYFGKIAIPGTIEESENMAIRNFIAIQNDPAQMRYVKEVANLELGYVDDDPTNNDYKDFDPGECGQCAGEGPAHVTVRVTHYKYPTNPSR